jgi:predicted acylesterase/phospholipase RssA
MMDFRKLVRRLIGPTPAQRHASRFARVGTALVLSGGGALGAYEAGVINGLVEQTGTADGAALPYDLICGTSIGALNAWFVATGQYRQLREIWRGIHVERVVRLKEAYTAIARQGGHALERLWALSAALRLASGLVNGERSVAQVDVIRDWLMRNVDPEVPVLVPLVWSATNMTTQRAEYFVRTRDGLAAEQLAQAREAIAMTVGRAVVVREATNDILHDALLGSAAIPLAFEPIPITTPTGTYEYADGGLTGNSPISYARTFAESVDVILPERIYGPQNYRNALDIVIGMFTVAQRRFLEIEMRDAYLQSLRKRNLAPVASTLFARAARGDEAALHLLIDELPGSTLRFVRPSKPLSLGAMAFDDRQGINDAFDVGHEDGRRGFEPFDWATFET